MRRTSIRGVEDLGLLALDPELCGVATDVIEAWANGSRIPTDLEIGRIAAATGMPVDRLRPVVCTGTTTVGDTIARRAAARRRRRSPDAPVQPHRPVECRGVPGVCAICGLPMTARNRRHLL